MGIGELGMWEMIVVVVVVGFLVRTVKRAPPTEP